MSRPILDGVWQFEARHPDWSEDEGGEDGWEPEVAWWAIASSRGLVLVDPLGRGLRLPRRTRVETGGLAGLQQGDELFDGWRVTDVERKDELALWLPQQSALVFGDAMIRGASGELRVCPESWTQPPEGPARLREVLRGLAQLPVEHVLVAHGPLVLADGAAALRAAVG